MYPDEHLIRNFPINQIKSKLRSSFGFLAKRRCYIQTDLHETVNFAILTKFYDVVFNIGVNTEVKQSKELKKNQEKVISFKDRTEITNPLFKKLKIMKMKDVLTYNSSHFVHDQTSIAIIPE